MTSTRDAALDIIETTGKRAAQTRQPSLFNIVRVAVGVGTAITFAILEVGEQIAALRDDLRERA